LTSIPIFLFGWLDIWYLELKPWLNVKSCLDGQSDVLSQIHVCKRFKHTQIMHQWTTQTIKRCPKNITSVRSGLKRLLLPALSPPRVLPASCSEVELQRPAGMKQRRAVRLGGENNGGRWMEGRRWSAGKKQRRAGGFGPPPAGYSVSHRRRRRLVLGERKKFVLAPMPRDVELRPSSFGRGQAMCYLGWPILSPNA
jgi:hypothetical protein